MSDKCPIPDTSINITSDGVSVGGHVLPGVTRYSVDHDPACGLFEVHLTLVTSRCRLDLGDGSRLVGGGLVDPLIIAQAELARIRAGSDAEGVGSYRTDPEKAALSAELDARSSAPTSG